MSFGGLPPSPNHTCCYISVCGFFPFETNTKKFSHEEKFKDITLSIQTNKNNINKQIKFTDAFPISVGDLSFTTQDTSVEYLTCAVSFRYNRFEFIR